MRIVVVLLIIAVVVVEARKTPNRPADGFEESGYYFPKMIFWHSLRTSPGRYWVAYAAFFLAILSCFGFSWVPGMFDTTGGTKALTQKEFLVIQNAYLGGTSVLITVVSSTLADVTLAYLVGLCGMQISVETTRFMVQEQRRVRGAGYHWTFNVLLALAVTSIFSVGLKDSYAPLNKVNAAYFIVCYLISGFSAIAYALPTDVMQDGMCNTGKVVWRSLREHIGHEWPRAPNEFREWPRALNEFVSLFLLVLHFPPLRIARALRLKDKHKLKLVMGSTASLFQLAFCITAFFVTKSVANVPQAVTKCFFYSTVAISGVTNIRSFWSFYSKPNLEASGLENDARAESPHSTEITHHPKPEVAELENEPTRSPPAARPHPFPHPFPHSFRHPAEFTRPELDPYYVMHAHRWHYYPDVKVIYVT